MHLLVLLSALSGFTHLHFGISLLRLNPKALSNRLFFLLCLSFGWWALAYSMVYPAASQAQAWFWFRISAPAWCFAPEI